MATPLSFSYILSVLFCVALAFQLLWTLLLHVPVLIKRKKKAVSTPPVSVIIAARNEAEHLKQLIPDILGQDYPDFEVIIALDRCMDDSLDIVKKWETKDKRIKIIIIDYLPDYFSPKKYALSLAAKKAVNDWLLLTDADCRPVSKHWIAGMAAEMNDRYNSVVGIAPLFKENGFLNLYTQYETTITALDYTGFAHHNIPYMGVGRNLAYRKSLFLANKGFNKFQNIHGGDDDLFIQYHGKPIGYCLNPDTLTLSPAKQDFPSYWEQKKRHYRIAKYYKGSFQYLFALKFMAMLVSWIGFFVLLILEKNILYVSIGLILLLLTKMVIIDLFVRKTGHRFGVVFVPLIELIYIIFVPVATVISFFSKKISWK